MDYSDTKLQTDTEDVDVGKLELPGVADPQQKWPIRSSGSTPYVFISHTDRDHTKEEIARPTHWFLKNILGVDAFLDAISLERGVSKKAAIAPHAYACTHALVILSPSYRKRTFCVQELNLFMSRLRRCPTNDFRVVPALWLMDNVDGYHSDVKNLIWIRHGNETQSEISYMIQTLWPALHSIFKGKQQQQPTKRELEENLVTYVEEHLDGPSQIPVELKSFYNGFLVSAYVERYNFVGSTVTSDTDITTTTSSGGDVGIMFSCVYKDDDVDWNERVIARKDQIEGNLRLLASLGSVSFGDINLTEKKKGPLSFLGLGKAVVRLDCHIEFTQEDWPVIKNKVKQAAMGIVRLLRDAGTTEEELRDMSIGAVWEGSLQVLLEAQTATFETLFSSFIKAQHRLYVDNGMALVDMVPAFTLRDVSFRSRRNGLSDKGTNVDLYKHELFGILRPKTPRARSQLLAGGVRYDNWFSDQGEVWESLLAVYRSSLVDCRGAVGHPLPPHAEVVNQNGPLAMKLTETRRGRDPPGERLSLARDRRRGIIDEPPHVNAQPMPPPSLAAIAQAQYVGPNRTHQTQGMPNRFLPSSHEAEEDPLFVAEDHNIRTAMSQTQSRRPPIEKCIAKLPCVPFPHANEVCSMDCPYDVDFPVAVEIRPLSLSEDRSHGSTGKLATSKDPSGIHELRVQSSLCPRSRTSFASEATAQYVGVNLPNAQLDVSLAESYRKDNSQADLPTEAILELLREGFPLGLIKEMDRLKKLYPISFWVVDNSGSMHEADRTRLVNSDGHYTAVKCSRWSELCRSVEKHAHYAGIMGSHVTFRLLNDPGIRVGPRELTVDTLEDAAYVSEVLEKIDPSGSTPLENHLEEIKGHLEYYASELKSNEQKAVVVLATDGIPSNAYGESPPVVLEAFANTLRSLQQLPVWIVIRLCTSEPEVLKYYESLDLKGCMEVIVDYPTEALKIYKHNRWLTYGGPLHWVREMGCHRNVLDLVQERPLEIGELRYFFELLFGVSDLPDPTADWGAFMKQMKEINEKQQWCPITRKMTNWVDLKKLNSVYGGRRGLFQTLISYASFRM